MINKVYEIYKKYGIDVYEVINKLKDVKVSIHCWQLDDVGGFESSGALSGGIQATGNYPGKARNFEELKQDLDVALKHIPGSKKINLHASYQTGEIVDRKDIGVKQFENWVQYAKDRGLGLDYNPTIFSSPMLVDGLSLSSPVKEVRDYWIEHCKNSIKVSEYFGKELNQKSLCNIWIPDGLKEVKVSIHCWQLDDVGGFESSGALSGGIQATGNYPGKARNFEELKQDLDVALKHIPGSKKINLHASYQTGEIVDRKDIGVKQFENWVQYAKDRGLGLDYNPTIFSSPMLVDGLSLSSPVKEVRDYWIEHCKNSIKVSEYFGKELNQKSLCNIWIPDGLKEVPSDRLGPRQRLKESLDEILKDGYDKKYMDVSVESKVFGIGVESYTVGSNEFYLSYAMKNDILCLLDTGHFHPTENVADKISSLILFSDKLAFHVSRPVRWDSDHVLKLDDNLQEVCDELVKCDILDKTYIGLDYFDASINRVAALIIGARNMQKGLLRAMLTPWDKLKKAQDESDHTLVLALQEEIKTLPWSIVWDEYLKACNVLTEDKWFEEVRKYEEMVLKERGSK